MFSFQDSLKYFCLEGLVLVGLYWFLKRTVMTKSRTSKIWNTVQRRYNAVNFLPNPHKIHPIARPLGRGMVCNLCFDTLIYILLQSTQCRIRYRVIFDRIITALNCVEAGTKWPPFCRTTFSKAFSWMNIVVFWLEFPVKPLCKPVWLTDAYMHHSAWLTHWPLGDLIERDF